MITLESIKNEEQIQLIVNFLDDQAATTNKIYWQNTFQTIWENNPYLSDDLQKAWILVENEKIGGFLGSIPTQFWAEREAKTTFSATSWFVSHEFRKKSIYLLYKIIDQGSDTFIFNNTASETVAQILLTFGFKLQPTCSEKLSILFVNHAQSLQFFFIKKWESKTYFEKIDQFLIKPLSFLASPLLYFKQKIGLKLGSNLMVKEVTQADQTFDQLWERTKNKFEFTGVRTSESMNWFCADANFEKKIFAYYEENSLKGYAIFRFRKAAHRFKQLEMLDFWAEDFDKALPPIVSFAKEFAKKNEVTFITFSHFNPQISQILGNLGLQEVFVGKNAYYKADTEIMEKLNYENSYFTHLQGDYGFA